MGKRVLVISNMYPSNRTPTYGIFVKNQVQALREKGVQIDTAVNKDNRGGKINLLRKYLLWLVKILIRLITNGRKYDVVHAHYIFPSGLPALLFKKLFKSKLIVTSHGGDLDQMAKKNKLIFRMTKYILKEADHVIVVGEALKQEVTEEFGVDKNQVSLINMGVNRTVFAPTDSEKVKKELNLSQESFHILFVGNLIKAKGLKELITAFQRLPDKNAELHIIGSMKDEGFLQELKTDVASEYKDAVHFHGTKDQQTLGRWMAAADLFVLPSHIEGFGLVALEAMSCHTPVVGTDVGGLHYLLSDGAGILVEPKDASSIQQGIEQAMASRELREEMIRKGEAIAEENDEKTLLNRIIDLYNN
ncbi:glycosyltransferase [Halobacillus litoralis]|uniref:Glycosyl transferase family 1 n=1 Tax=Halobacillus litoralis TaxID=45668 RepID=A0A410MFF7_9BACI|nr:glycosyltransferase [Halobacillus litoralis]QAS53437.1 glycosyl transferase family 1 [Halobacillus litoralis]